MEPPVFITRPFTLNPEVIAREQVRSFTLKYALKPMGYGLFISGAFEVIAVFGQPQSKFPYSFTFGAVLTVLGLLLYRSNIGEEVKREAANPLVARTYSDPRIVSSDGNLVRAEYDSGCLYQAPWEFVTHIRIESEWVGIYCVGGGGLFFPISALEDASVIEALRQYAKEKKLEFRA